MQASSDPQGPYAESPLVVAFVADMFFGSKLQNSADHLGYRLRWIENTAVYDPSLAEQAWERPGEQLHGLDGWLFEHLTDLQPVLLLFDLTNEAIPWERWIPQLKSSPATRRIPIVAFGPHVDAARLREARRLGADAVYTRSQLAAQMPALLQENARIPDRMELRASCQQPLAPLARSGIERFNAGEFYKAHDDLEEAWRQDDSPARDLYRGILQVGIAYFQIERGNYRGAAKMLLRVRQWLEPLPPLCRGVNIDRLRDDVTAVHSALIALGPAAIAEFDRTLFQPVELVEP
jgi:predicted metal-dependent hydrolase